MEVFHMTHPLTERVRAVLEQASNPSKAPQMQRYMKSSMPYRGVTSPDQRRLWRETFPAYPLSSSTEWQTVALELWRDAAFREERYAAIALTDLKAYAHYRTPAAIPMVEEMIVTGAWWDYVDALATHHLGDILRAEQRTGKSRRIHTLMRRWARGESLWKRRAAILCQIRFKQDTDLDLLYACLAPNLQTLKIGTSDLTSDFFIRKAIGWALRQYAWVDPREVHRYVKAHRAGLSPLSVREATRNIGVG
jgi:3-methyladenine DNA glycosylase AlkD